jgi:multiple sugar transport system ATP-binding protein
VTVTDGGGTVEVGNQTIGFGPEVLARFPNLGDYSGQRIILGIRPEDFEDAAIATNAPADRRLRGTAKLVEALGSELMVHFVLDNAKTVNSGDPDAPEQELGEGISNAVARFSPRSRVQTSDDQIEVAVTTDNLHFFDASTRQRIQ